MAPPSPGDWLWRAEECPQVRQKRNVPICRLEGTEEDGVGSGFAELELVAGIELGGTAGLDLNADARGPVYHHGSVGGRQVLDVPDILSIAPDMAWRAETSSPTSVISPSPVASAPISTPCSLG